MARDFAASSGRTTTTPWDGRPYSTAADEGARAMQTRAKRSSSPRTSTRTLSFDLKASEITRHASGMIVPAGFVTRITTDPIRCSASRSSGSSWRFVLKSTRQMSGERPRATRSNVQKSPTVTTGLAPPIAGRMASPLTSFPKGHRRYSRSDSGRRNVTAARHRRTGAAFRTGAVLFDPVELAERRLSHREPDFRFARRAFVQRDRDDARSDLVANPKVPLRVLADEPLSLFVHVDSIVHDLRDMQEAVQGTESHEGAEFKDFHHGALDDFLERRREDQRVVSDSLVDGAVSVDGAPLA